jgi:hypothetical protein
LNGNGAVDLVGSTSNTSFTQSTTIGRRHHFIPYILRHFVMNLMLGLQHTLFIVLGLTLTPMYECFGSPSKPMGERNDLDIVNIFCFILKDVISEWGGKFHAISPWMHICQMEDLLQIVRKV